MISKFYTWFHMITMCVYIYLHNINMYSISMKICLGKRILIPIVLFVEFRPCDMYTREWVFANCLPIAKLPFGFTFGYISRALLGPLSIFLIKGALCYLFCSCWLRNTMVITTSLSISFEISFVFDENFLKCKVQTFPNFSSL